jgi:hypothetical protein
VAGLRNSECLDRLAKRRWKLLAIREGRARKEPSDGSPTGAPWVFSDPKVGDHGATKGLIDAA